MESVKNVAAAHLCTAMGMDAGTHIKSAMEADPISKNGACRTSWTSRGNLTLFALFILLKPARGTTSKKYKTTT